MTNTYVQIKRSSNSETINTLKFGELAVSDFNNKVKLFVGKNDETVQLLVDSSIQIPSLFNYNNLHQKYVSQNGDDLNNGQINQPYLTINKALDNTSQGGIILIEGGYYNEELIFNDDLKHSRKYVSGIQGNNVISYIFITNKISYLNNVKQITLSNLLLSYSGVDDIITINCSTANQNFNFNNISVSGSVITENIIRVLNNGYGYIDISNCDFNNKTIKLNNTTIPRWLFISNSRNIKIDAGIGWYVSINDGSQNIIEISNNLNILRSWMVTDIVSSEPSTDGIYIASDAFTSSDGNSSILKGCVFTKYLGTLTITDKYYTAKPSYYVLIKDKTYIKSQGTFYESSYII